MHEGHSSICLRKEFGIGKIRWLIKNYFAATNGKKWVLDSPKFVMYGDQCTEWQMSLKIHCVKGIEYVLVYLKCLEPSPSQIMFNWKMFSPFEVDATLCEIECDIEQKKDFAILFCSAGRLEDLMRFTKSDTLTIKCQLIAYSKDRKMYDRPKDLGLKSLTQDMRVLFKVAKSHDITMQVRGETVTAHKAVLCARSDYLKDLIEKSDSEEPLDFQDLTAEAVKYAMGYLYSGNLDYVLRTPSFSILKCIKQFKMKELEVYYKKDSLVLISEYDAKKHILEWKISDIDIGQNLFISPVLEEKDLNMSFRLYIYSDSSSKCTKEYVSIFIEIVDGSFPQVPYFEFAVVDSNDKIQYLQRKRWSDETKKFGLESFLLKDTFEDLTKDGCLRIQCSIMIYSKSGMLKAESKFRPSVAVETEPHYEQLGRQISYLFESGLYSDFTIRCEGGSFKVHSYILGARSYVLKNMFEKLNAVGEGKLLCMQSTKYDILVHVLSYIYSGQLETQEFEKILKLYEAAEKFSMLSLKYTCSGVLQRNLNESNISRILDLADLNKDYKLKHCAVRYLSENTCKMFREMCMSANELD